MEHVSLLASSAHVLSLEAPAWSHHLPCFKRLWGVLLNCQSASDAAIRCNSSTRHWKRHTRKPAKWKHATYLLQGGHLAPPARHSSVRAKQRQAGGGRCRADRSYSSSTCMFQQSVGLSGVCQAIKSAELRRAGDGLCCAERSYNSCAGT